MKRFLCFCLTVLCLYSFSCKIDGIEEKSNSKYGSISINLEKLSTESVEKDSSRALYIKEILNATVTVSGYGMETVEKSVKIENGKGSISFDKIPVGKNRVVSVQAESTLNNAIAKIDGVVMYAATDINSGENTVNVNWATSAVGAVYFNLIKENYDVSKLEKSSVESFIPPSTHAALVNTKQIALDIKNGVTPPQSAQKYKLESGKITFYTEKSYSDVIVQICDPVSVALTGTTGETQTIENVAPGTWNFYVIKNDSIIYRHSATVKSGETLDLSCIILEYSIGSKHPASGKYSPVDQSNWASASYALGAELDADGNGTFAVYSKNATKILLELYNAAYGEEAAYDYWMEKGSDDIWRAKINGIASGTLYAFRAWGPNWTFDENWDRGGSSVGFVSDFDSAGNRFNPNKVLFDPYSKEISHDKSNPVALGSLNGGMYGTGEEMFEGAARRNFDTGKYASKSVVIKDSTSFGTKPKIPQEKAIIYEAHARGITKHPSSAQLSSILKGFDGFDGVVNIPTEYQGTYKGAGKLAPYLKALGVNTIELLPVHESDNDANPDDAPGGNYWAYMTYGYFAPDRRYSSDKSYGGPTREFKEMVKAFHDEGMEVYLDVVFNHSGEGGTWYGGKDSYKTAELTFMRGFDNSTYYSLVQDNVGGYWETTGCGNNLQCDNPVVRKFILDSLTYWIDEMGVDGYRFDLATVLGREKSSSGSWDYNENSQTLKDIVALGIKNDVEMIAESWDCGSNSYQVGNFPEGWGGWNGRFRDSLRSYVGKGERGSLNNYINGDYENFNKEGGPHKSVNFVVAHDGFTLADLCSYQGAGNAMNSTLTWPFGPSDGGNGDYNTLGFGTEPENKRQAARNYIAIQMISRGVPMIVWGDEFSRTQNGNNNPYNIDSVATWSNYNMINTSSPHLVATGGSGAYHNNFGTFGNDANVNGNFKFMNYMLKLRASEPAFQQANYSVLYEFKKEDGSSTLSDGDRCVWLRINGSTVPGGSDYLVFMNMYTEKVGYTIPAAASGKSWVRLADTQNCFEGDFNCWNGETAEAVEVSKSYGVAPWSVVILKQVSEREKVSNPVISSTNTDSSGNFSGSTNVTISCSTSGASVYYTLDGSTPSATNGTKYSSPFTVTSTVTVKAVALKQGAYSSAVVTQKFTNTAAVETPVLSVPEGDFWNTITVFAFSDTKDAKIYYTTNGSEPTTSSTLYTDNGIKINGTTTLKVVATKSGLENSQVVSAKYTKQTTETYTEDKSGVMLQGFNWDSAPRGSSYSAENPNPKWYKWYGTMLAAADDIKDTFEYVWFPPASKTDTASSEGYAPTQLNDLNNCYGTEEELKNVIQAIKPAKAIADIVVNHRAGTTSWGDFTNPRWTDDYYSICSDDEGFSTVGSPMNGSSKKGAADSGMAYAAYRDLDHTNLAVQQGIYSWMNSVLKRAGFVGWRYDYVKGFGGEYVGYYNAMSETAFSVGEYWPDGGTSWDTLLNNWVNKTATTVNSVAGKKSRAFDFVLKQNLNNAFGWYKVADGVSTSTNGWNMSLLADSTSLMRSAPETAVTFVDNHDTGSTQQHWELNWDNVPVAYAFILTHPGYPCVAWQHYFTGDGWQYRGGEAVYGTTNTFKQHIDYLIDLRKSVGIEYDDTVEVLKSTETLYAAKITGTKGEIVVEIGGEVWSPSGTGYAGNYPVYQGGNFKIWQKGEAGIAPTKVDVTVNAASGDSWIWDHNAEIFAWVWGGSYGSGQWVKASGSGTTINLSIYDDIAGFNFARCVAGTTQPNWSATGDNTGRIYNKSPDVTFVKGTTTYSVGAFVEYTPGS